MDAKQEQQVLELLRRQLERSSLAIESMEVAQIQAHARQLLSAILLEQGLLEQVTEQQQQTIIDHCIGLGPLTALLADAQVSEVMVNDYQTIFKECQGKLYPTELAFTSEAHLMQVIDRIVIPLGRRLDQAQPMVDARLPDGSRVNAVLGPVAVRGTCLTIRKFHLQQLELADLVDQGSISEAASEYLEQAVIARKNILIAGGTGTGKTTLLNVLSSSIPNQQRILTIEDSAELQLHHDNIISLEARPANVEGKGLISIRDLLINALRMRPDRIIIGECRGGEALDMLQAMNTGHEGSLTTLHANNPREALQRLEVMVMMAGMELPISAIRQQIAAAIDVIVHITRFSDGRRGVSAISELTGMDGHTLQLAEIFSRDETQLVATGIASEWQLCS